jgi:hypothetical protein
MIASILEIRTVIDRPQLYLKHLDRLEILFSEMDRKFKKAADFYGFVCTGCDDNCCLSRFFHHSLLEYLYLFQGYKTLSQDNQHHVLNRAMEVKLDTTEGEKENYPVRRMCPLNFDTRCILYHFRPMICRLHGIPHELRKPGQQKIYGSGCEEFIRKCHKKPYFEFDRTAFYAEMADLEKDLRKVVGFSPKIKMTVAEMIISFQGHETTKAT